MPIIFCQLNDEVSAFLMIIGGCGIFGWPGRASAWAGTGLCRSRWVWWTMTRTHVGVWQT